MAPTNRCQLMEMLPKGGVGAEIGVLTGGFSERILELAQPSLLYLVDAWAHRPKWGDLCSDENHMRHLRHTMTHLRRPIAEGQVRVICAPSHEAVDLIPACSLDWVYVDAGHSYRECYADMKRCYLRVKPGGMMMGHDYDTEWRCFAGVTRAVDEFAASCGIDRVQKTGERKASFWFRKPG